MAVDVFLVVAVLAQVAGVLLGWLVVKGQIALTEARYRSEFARWKLEAAKNIRKDSVNRSRFTLKGKIAGQMAPASQGTSRQ